MRKIILAIFQLQIGALSENLTRKINDGIFKEDQPRQCAHADAVG